jgi:type IV pilus assembly protein PilM
MTEAELDESIYWEAEQYIPFDIQDVNLDYQILDAGTGRSKGTMEVLLVAAKKEKIADYTGVIAQAGRTPVVVDVDAFALQNAYELNYGLEPRGRRAAERRRQRHQHQHPHGRPVDLHARYLDRGNSYTEAVQKELNLPFDSAEQLETRLAGRRSQPSMTSPSAPQR